MLIVTLFMTAKLTISRWLDKEMEYEHSVICSFRKDNEVMSFVENGIIWDHQIK